jgi:hypothetical protein
VSRPKRTSSTPSRKKRAKTHLRYDFVLEVSVPKDSVGVEQKRLLSNLNRILREAGYMGIVFTTTSKGNTVPIEVKVVDTVKAHLMGVLERYRTRTATLGPREPKVNPGGR